MPSKSNKKKAAAEKSAAKLAAGGGESGVTTTSADTPNLAATAVAPLSAELATLTVSNNGSATPVLIDEAPASTDSSPTNNLEPTVFTLPDKIACLQKNKPLKVITNSYEMDVKTITGYRYDVSVSVQEDGNNKYELSGTKGGDRRRQADLTEIVQIAMKQKLNDIVFIYDGAKTLYSPTQFLTNAIRSIDTNVGLSKVSTSVKNSYFLSDKESFRVLIELNTAQTKLISSDLMKESYCSSACPTTQMVQIALSEEAKRAGFLIMDGGSEMFDKSNVQKFKGVEDLHGIGAGIKIAKGSLGKGAAHLILDYKKKQFFSNGPLSSLNLDFCDFAKARSYLKGLRVSTTYFRGNRPPQSFIIDGVSNRPMSQIEYVGGSILDDAVKLSGKPKASFNMKWPAVEMKSYNRKEGRRITYSFPIENLLLTPHQKLNPKHGNPPRCEKPARRFELTKQIGSSAGLLTSNETLKKFGVSINSQPIIVEAVTVPIPTIAYKGSTSIPNLSKQAKWDAGRVSFIDPAKIPNILMLYNSASSKDTEKLVDLKQSLATTAKQLGVAVGGIGIENLAQTYRGFSVVEAIEQKMASLATVAIKPVVMYADYSSSQTHGVLKLQERLCEVVTQQVSFDKSLSKPPGKSTLTNFMLKLNLKSGGLNHKVIPDPSITHLWGDSSKTLFISYDVCHSSGEKLYKKGEVCEEPSCVGFGFNGTKTAEAIIGDFHYQLPRKEKVDGAVLKTRARFMLNHYLTSRRQYPEHVVVLRDGVSEGQHGMVRSEEFPMIQQGIMEVFNAGKKSAPAFALLIVTKRHANRLYVKDDTGIINVPPLTAIDQAIVRNNGTEVIFVSHCPLNGTAQPIVINMLLNEKVFKTNDELVKLMAVLCCAHQSSTTIVSLPETIYAADEYAKRGSDLFQAYKTQCLESRTPLPTDQDGQLDFLTLTQKLCYQSTKTFNTRRIA